MAYSSIIQRPCHCGCGKMPTMGFSGYNSDCRPDIKAEKIKKHNARQYQKQKVGKLVREQMQDGNHDQASMQALRNDLDFVVSRYIRMLYADSKNGFVQCFTCPTIKHFSLMQNGHFIPRSNMATRWFVKNLRPQCPNCNEGKHGNLEIFAERLEQEENGIVEYLKELSRETQKFGIDELKQMLYDFRAKLRIVESKFKN